MDKMYSLNEIGLIPAALSNIEHRSDINPYYPTICKDEIVEDTFSKLPIFVSPMSCILNEKNIQTFQSSKVIPIMSRSENILRRLIWSMNGGWIALSLQEFENSFCNEESKVVISDKCHHILIDVANGHMSRMYDSVRKAKAIWKDKLIVMIGNIANPNTYLECCKAGVDYVRVGIGGGCFIPGQKVTLANGEDKNIEDIKVGDIVKTHTGENHKVEETHCYDRDEILYDINGIKCTANHEFYVINISDEEKVTEENLSEFAYWLPADKLDMNLHRLIEL